MAGAKESGYKTRSMASSRNPPLRRHLRYLTHVAGFSAICLLRGASWNEYRSGMNVFRWVSKVHMHDLGDPVLKSYYAAMRGEARLESSGLFLGDRIWFQDAYGSQHTGQVHRILPNGHLSVASPNGRLLYTVNPRSALRLVA